MRSYIANKFDPKDLTKWHMAHKPEVPHHHH